MQIWLKSISFYFKCVIFYIAVSTSVINAKYWDAKQKIDFRVYNLLCFENAFVECERPQPIEGRSAEFDEFPLRDGVGRLVASPNFDKSKPIVMVVHGAFQDSNSELVRAVIDSFGTSRKYRYYNVIAPHLPELVAFNLKNRLFFGVLPKSKVIGRILGDFFRDAIRGGVTKPEWLSMIGYCLGAHVAGYTARRIGREFKTLVEYIAGVDPVGAGYNLAFGTKPLNKYDARVVHQFHTHAYYFTAITVQADFVFNGGLYQPGCGSDVIFCCHSRAMQYFAESVINKKAFAARQCSSIADFNMCTCQKENPDTIHITFPPDDRADGLYFLRTRDTSPFGAGMSGTEGALCSKRRTWYTDYTHSDAIGLSND